MFDDPWNWIYTGASFVSGFTNVTPEAVLMSGCGVLGWLARPAGRAARATLSRSWRTASAAAQWLTTAPELSDTARAALDALTRPHPVAAAGHQGDRLHFS